jgi:K+-transporting ATPase ATPase C chain
MLRRQVVTGVLMTAMLTVLLGLVFPLVITGIAQVTMGHNADGSLVKVNGQPVGSSLIGQNFSDADGNPIAKYFQPRPSAAGNGYDAMASGGSQLGPSNPKLLQVVTARARAYRALNGLPAGTRVPVDAVTASGSGLDPAISVANARLQAPRVARARAIDVNTVSKAIADHTADRPLGFLGEQTVNVLELNLALDRTG